MVTVVQSASGSGFNASDHGSLTNATGAGNTILLGVNFLSTVSSVAGGATSMSDATNGTYTLKGLETVVSTHYVGGIGTQFGLFPAAAAVGAAAAISWVIPNASAVEWTLWELTPCTFDQASTGTGTNGSSNNETAICSAITPGANGAFIGSLAMLDDGVGAGTIGAVGTAAAWTLVLNAGGGSGEWGSEYVSQTTAASVTGDFKLTRAGTYVGSQISLIPTGGGAPAITGFIPSRMPLGA